MVQTYSIYVSCEEMHSNFGQQNWKKETTWKN